MFIDYFLSLWKKEKFDRVHVVCCESSLCAVVVAICPDNTHLCTKEAFGKIFLEVFGVEFEKELLCSAQIAIFEQMQNGVISFDEVLQSLHVLEQNMIVKSEYIGALVDIFSQKDVKRLDIEDFDKSDFKASKERLLQSIAWLKDEILESDLLKSRCENLEEKILDTKFSIGVTGVMNAGKSTFLNAILGKELLGTSTVPETANLTIIKYSPTPYAIVNFWNKSQWTQIEESAKYSSALSEFVRQTKEKFGEKFDEYVVKNGRSEEIRIDELPSYTSAKLSNGMCNIVKNVELCVDISLGDDGINIVDTPGIDDIVVQREEITKEYVANCDVMVHLMNASQASTKKDVDFLIDAIIYQRVSRVILLITRVDTIGESELKEVIEYTKKSIEKQLHTLNKPHLVKPILQSIVILPLAGRYALMHRLGQGDEALKSGYSLEKSGILEVERELNDIIFGGQRAKLMLDSSIKEINLIKNEELANFGSMLDDLNLDIETLLQRQKELAQKSVLKDIESALCELGVMKREFGEYFATLEHLAVQKSNYLKNELSRRINDDISYELRKNGAFPRIERLCQIFEQGIKDGVLDLVREFRFTLFKQIDSKYELFALRYGKTLPIENYEYDGTVYKQICAREGILSFSTQGVCDGLKSLVQKASKKEQERLAFDISVLIGDFVDGLQKRDKEKLKRVAIDLIEEFYLLALAPLEAEKLRLEAEQRALKDAIELASKEQFVVQGRKNTLRQKIELLEEFGL